MGKKDVLRNIWCLFLEFTAVIASKINTYNKEQIGIRELFIMEFYNGIYSTFFSAIGSLSVAVVASLFTQNLYNNWFVFFIIFMILNSLMLFVNLSSKTLNVPMILMRLIFSLKNKFHSFKRLMFYIVKLYIAVWLSISSLYLILLHFFVQYNVPAEHSYIYALILSVGLSVAGVYSFPVKKSDRDINELLVSPVFIMFNIFLGYKTSKTNILNNASQGNTSMAGYLLTLFFIAAFVQVITYLKKLFEMLHQLPEYEKEINNYSNQGKERFVFLKEYFKESLMWVNQLIMDFKSKKNAKRKLLLLISFFLIMAIGAIYFSKVIALGINYLEEIIVLFKLENLISKIFVYIILLVFCLLLIYKLYICLFLALKRDTNLKRIERWEYFSLALFIFGILIVLGTTIFSIRSSSNSTLVAGGFIVASTIIFSGVDLIKKFLSKQKEAKKEDIK
ncbi:teichoic acid transporter [Bacillus thuringiensis]|uniref:teichoic acid transporter n=1 Tax=Bacillus thuringiensis TaxID=1428 RepID=UPI000EC30828|nr:teichoic acid transporter [Bacillus thuringiensis]MDZ3953331.1 teichoic acid transporter [Bacillus thuringiensis]RGP57717.1 teichoic acid transporter [Bacillus thuringiensis]